MVVKGIKFGACPGFVPEKFNIKPPTFIVGKSLNTMILINKAQYNKRRVTGKILIFTVI
jgi:hypothetical protein